MKVAILGSGAVGGFYGALLARQGHDVTFLARGAHLDAIRARGMTVRGPLGDFTVRARAEADPRAIGAVDVVLFAVKAYSNAEALPMLAPLVGSGSAVLTLQNGVDSVDEVAAAVGERATLGGATYVATAIAAPGVIAQTGTHRRVVFGEVFGERARVSDRVQRIADAMQVADIHAEPVADARVPLWEKFVYLAAFAGFTGAARLPIGPLWQDPVTREQLLEASAEIERVGRAEGVALPQGMRDFLIKYLDDIPASTRSSLLIDLEAGKPLEVETLQGSVVRRGRAAGIPTPIMETLYAVLKPWAHGMRNAEC